MLSIESHPGHHVMISSPWLLAIRDAFLCGFIIIKISFNDGGILGAYGDFAQIITAGQPGPIVDLSAPGEYLKEPEAVARSCTSASCYRGSDDIQREVVD